MIRPRSRRDHIRTSRGEDGALIAYDVQRDTGHVLNASAAIVYELADGTRSVAEIATQMSDRLGGLVDDDVVRLALQDLGSAGLLEIADDDGGRIAGGISRRSLMRRLAVSATAAALLPGIGSIENLSRAINPAPRLVGSSGQAGAGYYLQPFHATMYPGPYGTSGPGPRPYRPSARPSGRSVEPLV